MNRREFLKRMPLAGIGGLLAGMFHRVDKVNWRGFDNPINTGHIDALTGHDYNTSVIAKGAIPLKEYVGMMGMNPDTVDWHHGGLYSYPTVFDDSLELYLNMMALSFGVDVNDLR